MEGTEDMKEVDLEEQPLVQPPSPPPSPQAPLHSSFRKPAGRRRVLATPVRALSLVVLVIGVLFAAHLIVHDARTLVLLAAEWLCIFFVMSCMAACEKGPEQDAGAGVVAPSHGLRTVAWVALLSFAMALTVTMTFWVAAGLPMPAVAVLYLLSLLAISACFAALLDAA